MTCIEVPVNLPHPDMVEADWGDAFQITTNRQFSDIRDVARQLIENQPSWISSLLSVRDLCGKAVGLKTREDLESKSDDVVGFFPVLKEANDKIILGANDKHLNFCVVIKKHDKEIEKLISVTTLVQRHNLFGRIYLCTIMPFHRGIVKTMLSRIK